MHRSVVKAALPALEPALSQQAGLPCEATANGAHPRRAYPAYLESRPLFIGHSVYNVRQCADHNYWRSTPK